MMATIPFMQTQLKRLDASNLFQGLVITVIIISALLIGAKTHNLPAQFITVIGVVDLSITIFSQ